MPSWFMKSKMVVGARSSETERVQFEIFSSVPGFHHALSTREGGVSSGDFSSLNLGFHVWDEAEVVRENRRLWARCVGFDLTRLVAAQQKHGVNVHIVSGEDSGRGALDFDSAIPDCDALVTRESNVPLLILVADCAPILLVDPVQRACAVVHAGWRGALGGVTGKAVRAMNREFGSKPREVLAAIGPCLSVENLEFGEELAPRVEAVFAPAIIRENFKNPHLDLRALISNDLTRHGVNASRIEVSPLCPRERNDLFFSHRAQNGCAGRFGLVAWWEAI